MLDGAQNLARQLAFNSLIRAVHARIEIRLPWLEQGLRRGDHRQPTAAGDPQGASSTRQALTPPEDHPPLASPRGVRH